MRTILLLTLTIVGLFDGAGTAVAQPLPTAKKYALLVGVQDYTGTLLSNLKYAENDVTELAFILRAQRFTEVSVLTASEAKAKKERRLAPTAANVLIEVRRLAGACARGDQIVIAVSGHGVQLRRDGRHYFCPAGADLEDPKTLVGLAEVYDVLRTCPAATKVVIIDACRNDPFATKAVGNTLLDPKPKGPAAPPGGVVTLFSCRQGEMSAESDAYKHGVFFHHLLEGLRGKAADRATGKVDVLRLYQHLLEKVPASAKERGETFRQTPGLLVERELTEMVVLASQPHAATQEFHFAGPYADLSPAGKAWAEVLELNPPQCTRNPSFTADRRGLWVGTCGHPLPEGKGAVAPALVLFDTTTGRRVARHELRANVVNAVAFTRDGSRAYVGGCADAHSEGVILVIDLLSGRELDRWEAHTKCVGALHLSADGRFLISCADRAVRVWDTADGTPTHNLDAHTGEVTGVQLSADGRWALSVSAERVVYWDLVTGSPRGSWSGGKFLVATMMPEVGRVLVAERTDDGSTVTLRTGEETVERRYVKVPGVVSWIHTSNDGKQFVTRTNRAYTVQVSRPGGFFSEKRTETRLHRWAADRTDPVGGAEVTRDLTSGGLSRDVVPLAIGGQGLLKLTRVPPIRD